VLRWVCRLLTLIAALDHARRASKSGLRVCQPNRSKECPIRYLPNRQGTQGIVFECSERSHAPVPPTPVLDAVNLRRMGPVGSPRLWTALHDAVLYSDPRAASGGKVGCLMSMGSGDLPHDLSIQTLRIMSSPFSRLLHVCRRVSLHNLLHST
jgi:hypothetical protein